MLVGAKPSKCGLTSLRTQTALNLTINLLSGIIKGGCLSPSYFGWMQTSNASFEMLWLVADKILEAVSETPEGALERTMVREFEERGFSAEMFYGIVAELENAGLVRWRGNLLFRALLN
jgi:hypothetical protein